MLHRHARPPATFSLGGVTVSNFCFSATGAGSFSNRLWSNPENATSFLRLSVDSTAVLEPASWFLLVASVEVVDFPALAGV